MAHNAAIRVLVVEDHAAVRKGLVDALEAVENLVVVGEASNGPEALYTCYLLQPNVVLIGLRMDTLDTPTIVRLIRQFFSTTQVIVLAATEDDKNLISSAMKSGAAGYLLKNVAASTLANAIKAAYAGALLPTQRYGEAPAI